MQEKFKDNVNEFQTNRFLAGMGEKNQLLESDGIEAYLKYPGFDRERQKVARLSEKEKCQAGQFPP